MTQLCILDLQFVLLSIALLNYVENQNLFIFKTACDMMIFLTVLKQYIFLCIILMCISIR